MSKTPLVSIIMPVYNSEETLLRAVHGIQRQSYTNLQIILIDDGSTDGSLKMLEELAAGDSRIEFATKENGGPSTARNLGLDMAKGEWIAFHDSDDWMEPYAVERLVDGTTWGPCEMVVANFYRVCDGRYHVKGRGRDSLITRDEYVKGMSVRPSDFFYAVSWNKLMKRSIFEGYHLRLDETVRYGEDHLMMTQFLSHVEHVFVVGEPLYYYLDRPGSLLHQGLTPLGFAQNRLTIFPEYRRLLKESGASRGVLGKVKLAAFFITPSTDGVLLPWDKKLDESQVPN